MSHSAFVERIKQVAQAADLKVLEASDDLVVAMFRYASGRTQQVYMHRLGPLDGCQIVEIVSIARELNGDFDPQLALRLLRDNGTHKVGYWGLVEGPDGQSLLAAHHAMILDTLDPEELRIIVTALGVQADNLEREFGGDVH